MSVWSKLPPAALEAHLRQVKAGLKQGESALLHDIGCASQVGEACDCEPIVIVAEGGEA